MSRSACSTRSASPLHHLRSDRRRPAGILSGTLALLLVVALAGPGLAWPPGGNGGGKGGGGNGGGDPPADLIPLKIILMAGQSNMAGYGENADLDTLAPGLVQLQSDVLIYYGSQPKSSQGIWRELQPGLGQSTSLSDWFGPELSFGRGVADVSPSDNIALIKCRGNGTSLATDFDPDTAGPSWVVMVETVNNALAALDPDVYAPEIVGMIWSQGNRDARTEDDALAYEANLVNFIQAVRDEFGKPNLPFIFERIRSTDTEDFPYMSVVSQAQLSVWSNNRNSNLGLVDSQDISVGPDGGHFDAAGQLEFGARFAAEMLLIPDATIDSVAYATTGKRDRDLSVTVTLSDDMGALGATSVAATLENLDTGDLWDAVGITAGDGTVSFPLKNAPSGCYETTITDIGVLNWDPLTPANQFCK